MGEGSSGHAQRGSGIDWEPVIGLEVHAQLKVKTKLFCGCPTNFGRPANTQVCPVCLGLPGALPVLNRAAVAAGVRLALAAGCTVHEKSIFARKNYFYPDLPKGYQISQFEHPLATQGRIDIEVEGRSLSVGLIRIHLEEDAGKSIHEGFEDSDRRTYLDFNRSGVPLAEIVSCPEIRTPEEAHAYLTRLKSIVTYLDVCDGNMEEGSMRCDANVSLRPVGREAFGTRTELKNLNSFRNVQRALEYEIRRQEQVLRGGGRVQLETRLYDADAGVTRTLRSKEESHDYRYFPEPDLPPLCIESEEIERYRRDLPELPVARKRRFIGALGLPEALAETLSRDREQADYFERVAAASGEPRQAAHWVMGDLMRRLNEGKLEIRDAPVRAGDLATLIKLVRQGQISGKMAKEVFQAVADGAGSPEKVIQERSLSLESDVGRLGAIIEAVLGRSATQISQYQAGKTQVMGYFVGQVMQATRGQADPRVVNRLLLEALQRISSLPPG